MAIIEITQGSNSPIKIIMDFPIEETFITGRAILYHPRLEPFKIWQKDDMNIDEEYPNVLYLPLTEEETLNFPSGLCSLSLKFLNNDGEIVFTERTSVIIIENADKEPLTE